MNVLKLFGLILLLTSGCADESLLHKPEVTVGLNFIRSGVKPDKLLEYYDIERQWVTIKNINEANLKPSLAKQGFLFANFENSPEASNLMDKVKEVHSQFMSESERLKQLKPAFIQFEKHVKQWAQKQKMATAEQVICGSGFYRSTEFAVQALKGASSRIEFVHFDFVEGQPLTDLFKKVSLGEQMVDRFGDDANSEDFWNSHKLVNMINIWMPFDTVYAFPLAVLDISTLDARDISPFLANHNNIDGSFYSGGIKYRKNLQFYFKPEMKRGEAIVFRTTKTPHSAFQFSGQKGHRESYDIRCAFIAKK